MNFPVNGHCFVGLIALIDPPRVDVRDAIDTCRRAHIRVMMVTGDHPTTASAIARMVGIITNDHVVDIVDNNTLNDMNQDSVKNTSLTVKGSVIDILNKSTWDNILKHQEIVFARTTPEHKLIIVKECQKRKNVVAVTGDGVNDAPALKAADVGVAMGSGSDVARESAAIVLLDSKFSSIVAGIENGRMAFDNLKKVILYLLPAGSFSELTPVLASVFLGYPQPLSTFLMLAICVATDIFPSLSLIYEEAEADLMVRKPRSITKERLVNPQLLLHAYLFTGLYESIAAFTMFFYYMWVYGGLSIHDLTLLFSGYQDGFQGKTISELNETFFAGQTVFFVTLVLVQFGNLMSTRTRYLSFFQHNPIRGRAKNHKLFVAMVVSTCIAIFVVYLPLFNIVFRTRDIPTEFWFIPLGWAVLYFCIDELRKLIIRRIPPSVVRYVSW
ncbi:sodium/potassium-transporting ATPase subunit alpha [Acrasis kona]|uniref:Sodium/potassium-transporting ATPase subunit alpha n=1 Tax=Acrasis kona TaxID=1008807 RepID=A0AAW2ZE95_9EUKA